MESTEIHAMQNESMKNCTQEQEAYYGPFTLTLKYVQVISLYFKL